MATIPQLVSATSEALGKSDVTVAGYARFLREAGLLSQAGNGVNAAKATPRDAAVLVTAVMACPTGTGAPQFVRDFGALFYLKERVAGPVGERWTFSRFIDDFACLISDLGAIEMARAAIADRPQPQSPGLARVLRTSVPELRVTISPSLSLGGSRLTGGGGAKIERLEIDGSKSQREYQGAVANSIFLGQPAEPNAIALSERWGSKVRVEFWIELAEMLPIAACVHGQVFSALIEAAWNEAGRGG